MLFNEAPKWSQTSVSLWERGLSDDADLHSRCNLQCSNQYILASRQAVSKGRLFHQNILEDVIFFSDQHF